MEYYLTKRKNIVFARAIMEDPDEPEVHADFIQEMGPGESLGQIPYDVLFSRAPGVIEVSEDGNLVE